MTRDRGLAPERTALAWQRTAGSLVACTVVALRFTRDDLQVIVVVAGVGALVAWIGSGRSTHGSGSGPPHSSKVANTGMLLAASAALCCLVVMADVASAAISF